MFTPYSNTYYELVEPPLLKEKFEEDMPEGEARRVFAGFFKIVVLLLPISIHNKSIPCKDTHLTLLANNF